MTAVGIEIPGKELTGIPGPAGRLGAESVETPAAELVNGQTVVVIATTEVTTAVPVVGQLVMLEQWVTVRTEVVNNVVVVTALISRRRSVSSVSNIA
jgi:hypothetical protein